MQMADFNALVGFLIGGTWKRVHDVARPHVLRTVLRMRAKGCVPPRLGPLPDAQPPVVGGGSRGPIATCTIEEAPARNPSGQGPWRRPCLRHLPIPAQLGPGGPQPIEIVPNGFRLPHATILEHFICILELGETQDDV